MASVICNATFRLSNGELVDMSSTVVEGTATELLTSTVYSVSAVSIGQYAEGKTLVEIVQPPSCPNSISWAYINRRGSILCALPVAVEGVQSAPCPMPRPVTLEAGDTIEVMASTSSNRRFGLSVITNQGVHAIFDGTPSGSGNTDLTHILSGQGLGASLTNQRIVAHWATSIDGSKITSAGGAYYLNDRGLPQGGITATNPINLQPKSNMVAGATVGLNWVARVSTSS